MAQSIVSTISGEPRTVANIDRIKEIVARQVGRDPTEITESTDLIEAGYDSLDVLETIFALEEAFQLPIPFDANDPGVKGMRTVGDIVRMVDKAFGEQKPA